MASTIFDMFKARQALTKAGIDEKHAEAFVSMTCDAMADGVATKTDISELKGELKTDIARLETRIESIYSRLMLALMTTGGVIIAVVKFL